MSLHCFHLIKKTLNIPERGTRLSIFYFKRAGKKREDYNCFKKVLDFERLKTKSQVNFHRFMSLTLFVQRLFCSEDYAVKQRSN